MDYSSARLAHLCIVALLLTACRGGGGNDQPPPTAPPPPTFTATSGVAQKGPLILGSTITVQELTAGLAPTGRQYSYLTNSDFGTFVPNSIFTSPYLGVSATGYYFDEVRDAVSTGHITLNAVTDLTAGPAVNVNLLTTLASQRIQELVNGGLSFGAARSQAEREVLGALNINSLASIGPFSALDISKSTQGDRILTAISSLFVQGNTAGNLSALVANVRSDIGTNGRITVAATNATLRASAAALDADAVAAHLNAKYGPTAGPFNASDLSNWIDSDGDGVVGRFSFDVAGAGQSSAFTVPSFVIDPNAGSAVSVSAGVLRVNGVVANGAVAVASGDIVVVSPSAGVFENGALTIYLTRGSTRLARVTFVKGLVTIQVSSPDDSVPAGASQEFTATGHFSDMSSADLTANVVWTSSDPAVATIGPSTGSARAAMPGTTTISATHGSIAGSKSLQVVPASLASIMVTPNPLRAGIGMARQLTAVGTYTDGVTTDLTSLVTWVSDDPAVATVTSGVVTGVAIGGTTVRANLGGILGSVPLTVSTNTWSAAGNMTRGRSGFTTTRLIGGKILAVGGDLKPLTSGLVHPSNYVELYDPATDTWQQAPSPPVQAMIFHNATLLADGRVLVTGGIPEPTISPQSAASLYDPVSNTWTSASPMTCRRSGHAAALLPNGRVLVVGGLAQPPFPCARPVLTELYDPATNSWSPAHDLLTARNQGPTATLLADGRVLVAGGNTGGPSAEIYDPAADTWTAAAGMLSSRSSHSATRLSDGRVLVAGGSSTSAPGASAEIYDAAINTWSALPNMSVARSRPAVIQFADGRVLVAGSDRSAEILDVSTSAWSSAGEMLSARRGDALILLNSGAVLACGDASLTGGCEFYW